MFADPETTLFRQLIDPNFLDIVDIVKECPLVMLNSNELYELPRPTLSKIVNIGGLGMQAKEANPLSPEFQRIMDASVGLVLFSFGSVAPAHKMPLAWKKALLNAFENFPEYHFFMRYEETDLQGVPMITIALFGDQPRNAKLAEKHGISVNLRKSDVTTDAIVDALKMIFNDQSYTNNVKRLSNMAKKKPVSADHLLVA